MCHLSPTVHLAWAVLSCMLQVFLIVHLWRYDRFKCLAWSSGKQPGAFKRIMTYSYLTSVPALVVFTVAMTVLKYRNGYTFIPGFGIIPTPFDLWPKTDRDWLHPLYILFGFVWGLEIVTHLEELTFWLFLLHQGPDRREWFSSFEFRIWAIGSSTGMIGLPVTAILTRNNPLTAEAWVFLIGSASSMAVTFLFFIVLFKFPAFLRKVKREGAATPVVLRLVNFHELNIIRVIFRLFMTVPLIILGVDGTRGHHIINQSALWTDLLVLLSAVGTVVSSTMTLLIFFPRSLAEDSNWRPHSTHTQSHASYISGTSGMPDRNHHVRSLLTVKLSPRPKSEAGTPDPFSDEDGTSGSPVPMSSMSILSKSKTKYYSGHFTSPSPLTTAYYPPRENSSNIGGDYDLPDVADNPEERGRNPWREDINLENGLRRSDMAKLPLEQHHSGANKSSKNSENHRVRMMELGEAIDAGLKKPLRPPRLHPYITSFTSPIDLLDWNDTNAPRAL